MTYLRRTLGAASIAFALGSAFSLEAAAPAGTDLWGGPAAKGTGTGASFDSNVYVSSVGAATGSIDFIAGGATLASVPFTLPTRGSVVVPAPDALAGAGAFLYHVRTDTSVNAWAETFSDTPNGRYSTVTTAFPVSDFLAPGDESWGGGADASSSTAPGRARTNVGVLCSPLSTQGCTVEVAAFQGGAVLGAAQIFTIPGSAAQQSLAVLLPATAEQAPLALRFRMLTGAGVPYAIRNDNLTSDGSAIALSISRGTFSTAPVITSFTISPSTGCAPLTTTATWATTGADHVNITGAAGDLAASGTVSLNLAGGGAVTLTAVALSGATSVTTRSVSLLPPTLPPTPTPTTITLGTNQSTQGSIPVAYTGTLVTITFDQHDSSGSTFVVNGNQFTYTAGTKAGTDVVRLSVSGGTCGSASATFTATVIVPGAPAITSFTSIPTRGCGASSNIVLSWQTQNVGVVNIDPINTSYGLAPNGSIGTTIAGDTTFTLSAYPVLPASFPPATKTLTVPVDPQPFQPILTPSSVSVPASSPYVFITVTFAPGSGTPDLTLLRYVIVQNDSGSHFSTTDTPGVFAYLPGPLPGRGPGGTASVDIIRVFYTNGCGPSYTEFQATVN